MNGRLLHQEESRVAYCDLAQHAFVHLHWAGAHLHEVPSHPAHVHRQHVPLQSSVHLHCAPQLQLAEGGREGGRTHSWVSIEVGLFIAAGITERIASHNKPCQLLLSSVIR